MIKVNEEALKKAGQQFQAAKATVQSSGQAATPGAVLEEMHYQQSGEHSFNPNSAASYEAGIWDGYEGKERDDLYAGLDFAYNNAGSTLYNPYRHATNSEYTDTLKKYGLDVPDVITADWIDQQWGTYGGYLKKDKDGSLGKARNKNEQIARALYGLEGIEYTTQKAEKELDDIRQTVNWYAAHGYSQDYIAKVVGGMKHSTLDSIAITRDPKAIESTDDDGYTISTKRGTTVGLNRSVYFDDDILTGMYWKAINGVDDVSDFDAAVYAYQNKGKLRGGSSYKDRQRTYGTQEYNPHVDGCTNIDAKMAFGQDDFTYEDLLRLRAETDEFDTTKQNLLSKLFSNEDRTANAEKELASIRTDMARLDYTLDIPEGYKSPKEYFTQLADSWLSGDVYSTLATMDKRRAEGNPMDINRSVNYRREDIIDEMVARYNAAHKTTTDPKAALGPAKPMSQEDALRVASGEITPDQAGTVATEETETEKLEQKDAPAYSPPPITKVLEKTFDKKLDDEATQEWLEQHPGNNSFDSTFVVMKPSARAGLVAAGGNVQSDAPMGKPKTGEATFMATDGNTEFTRSQVVDIMGRAFSGDTADMTDEEKRMGNNLIMSIPWAFGSTPQWMGVEGFADSMDENGHSAMWRMEQTASSLGQDIRDVLAVRDDYYATASEKAELAMQFFEDAAAASAAGMEIGAWYENTPEGQRQKQDILDIAGKITERKAEIEAEQEAKDTAAKREALAGNIALFGAAGNPETAAQLTDEEKLVADSLALQPGEAEHMFEDRSDPDTAMWTGVKNDILDGLEGRFFQLQDENNGDSATAIRDLFGLDENADVSGISMYDVQTEMDGIVDIVKQFYAQDKKLAAASGMTLEEYYEAVGERKPEDLYHAAFEYRQLMNSEDSISDEAKQGIGFFASMWNTGKLAALDVASGDVGFITDIANLVVHPDDRESLQNQYTTRYGFFDGRNQYRDDVNTMLAYWAGQSDEASQAKFKEYAEKMRIIDENGLDIYNLGFNPDTDLLERVRHDVQMELQETEEWINQNATELEQRGIGIGRSAIGSTIQQTRALVASAVTGIPVGLTSAMSFLPGSFEGHMDEARAHGWDDTRSYMYAMIGGIVDAAMEGEMASGFYNFGGNAMAGWLNDTATKFAATHGITGLGAHLVYGLMVYGANSAGEISQELLQNVAGGVYDYLWSGSTEGIRESLSKDTVVDTILSTALSTFMSTTAHQATAEAKGAPSVFSNKYKITAAAVLNYSPEVRQQAGELLRVLNAGDGVNMFDGVSEAAAPTEAATQMEAPQLTQDEVLDTQQGPESAAVIPETDQEMAGSAQMADTLLDNLMNNPDLNLEAVTVDEKGRTAPATIKEEFNAYRQRQADIQAQLQDAEQTREQAQALADQAAESSPEMAEAHLQGVAQQEQRIADLQEQEAQLEQEMEAARRQARADIMAGKLRIQEPWNPPEGFTQVPDPGLDWSDERFRPQPGVSYGSQQEEMPELADEPEAAPSVPQAVDGIPQGQVTMEEAIAAAPETRIPAEASYFIDTATEWFVKAQNNLQGIQAQLAEATDPDVQASLARTIETVKERMNAAKAEVIDRLTKMDIKLKMADFVNNPEALANFVAFTAETNTRSKIAAGALTAKPEVKGKLQTKLDTAEEAAKAQQKVQTAEQAQASSAQALTNARTESKSNPSPEAAKREVAAAKQAKKAKDDAKRAKDEAERAAAVAQKAEEDLNKVLTGELESIRQESTEEARTAAEELKQTVNESLEDEIKSVVDGVKLPEIIIHEVGEFTTQEVDDSFYEDADAGQTAIDTAEEALEMESSEEEAEAQRTAGIDVSDILSRVNALNGSGKNRIIGNYRVIEEMGRIAQTNESIRDYLRGLDDESLQELLKNAKSNRVRAAGVGAFLNEAIEYEALNAGQDTKASKADAVQAARDKMKSLVPTILDLNGKSTAKALAEPAKTVQVVLAEELRQLEELKEKKYEAEEIEQPTKEIVMEIRKLRKRMAATMDFAAQVLHGYEGDSTRNYAGRQYGRFTDLNNSAIDNLKASIELSKNKKSDDALRKINRAEKTEAQFDSFANDLLHDINELIGFGNHVTPVSGKQAVQAYIAGPSRGGANISGSRQGVWPAGQRATGIAREGGKAENQPLRSTYQIGQKLASDLGVGLYNPTRRFYAGPAAAGAYYPGNEHIEVRGHRANDERVIYHEIGHHIQKVTGFETTDSMMENADPAFLKQYAESDQPGEAFAEFVRTYVNNREKACALYGEKEVQSFEKEMRKAGLFKPIQEAALSQMRLNTATNREIGESHMKDVNNRTTPQSGAKEASDAIRKFVIGMIDDTEAAARFDKKAGLLSSEHKLTLQDQLKLIKPSQKQATGMITNALTDITGKRISDGFAETIAGKDENGKTYKMSEQDLKDLANLSLYIHAVDRMNQAEKEAREKKTAAALDKAAKRKLQAEINAEIARRTAGMTKEQAEHFTLTNKELSDIGKYATLSADEIAEIEKGAVLTPEEAKQARLTTQVYNEDGDTGLTREKLESNIAEITERNPWAVDAHERMIGWWMDFTQTWGVDTGLITQKQYDDMWEKWPNYVPTYREGKGNELDFDSHTFDGSDGGFKIQKIVGSDRDVMNPLLGFSRNIGYYVEGARRNAALNNIYWTMQHSREGFGEFCREVKQPGAHTLSFRDDDGTKRYLEFQDRELFEVIADNCRPAQAGQAANTIGKLTRSMAMFTTGSNPLFAMKNLFRDFQQGVNHGSWAYTYAGGVVKWMRAAWEMKHNTKNAQSYKALAGEDGGRLSIPDNQKDADQLLRMFSSDYGRSGAVGAAQKVASKAWDVVTAKNFNEFIEQTTRYAEYRFGKHDLKSGVGRQKAYLAAQESTTNFSLSGNSELATVLRKTIPFFNAALQGTYSVVHATSAAERHKLAQRFTKTAVNNLLTGAFAYGILQAFGSDEDKEWYEKLANGVKADYIIIPLGGDKAREFLRIPLTQNPIGKLFYAAGQNIMSSATTDRLTLDVQATVSGILSDLIQTDVVFSPFLNAANNETYYGSAIVPNWMEKRSPTERYNENTADIFIKMARFFEALPITRGNATLTDPMKLQYITQQETGFIGKLLLPTLTGTRATGYNRSVGSWLENMWNIMRNDWTSDAAYSNDINEAYHQADDVLNQVMSDLSGAGYTDLMARNSSPEFVQEAHNVAAYLVGSTGPFKRISEEINGLYDQQDAIYNNDKLTTDEKLAMARDIQKKIVNLQAEGVGIYKEYASTYLNQHYGLDYVLYGGAKGDKNRSSVYGFPILAAAENSGKYEGLNNIMSHYKEIREKNNGKANSALNPCPSTTVDITDEYSVPMYAMEPDAAEEYQNVYLENLERGMAGYNSIWRSMDNKKKAAAISEAKKAANKAAKAAVVRYYQVNGLIPSETKEKSGTLPDPRK